MTNKLTLAHLGLGVYDFDRMVDFYTRTMGMVVSDTDTLPRSPLRIAFLTANAEDHHQLVLVEGRRAEEIRTSPPIGGSIGCQLFQLSFKLADLATLRTMQRRIAAEGLTNFVPINHGNAWALYIRDPEGNALELYVDSPWHVAQPCGLPLDLTQTDGEILAATEQYCAAQPGHLPAGEFHSNQAERIAAAQQQLA